jgi:hypothetical protein
MIGLRQGLAVAAALGLLGIAISARAERAQPSSDMVLFWGVPPYLHPGQTLVVPLACYAKAQKALLSGARCLDLIPAGAAIANGDNGVFAVDRRVSFSHRGGGKQETVAALAVKPGDKPLVGTCVYPPAATGRVMTTRSGEVPRRQPTDQEQEMVRAALEHRLKRKVKAEDTQIEVYSADIDGDGFNESIFEASIGAKFDGEMNIVKLVDSTLFVSGNAPGELKPVFESRDKIVGLFGLVALAGDQTQQLWLELRDPKTDRDTFLIGRMSADKLEKIGAWTWNE